MTILMGNPFLVRLHAGICTGHASTHIVEIRIYRLISDRFAMTPATRANIAAYLRTLSIAPPRSVRASRRRDRFCHARSRKPSLEWEDQKRLNSPRIRDHQAPLESRF